MILGRQTHCSRGWLVQLVAALVALLATIFSSAPPSAAADAGAETRVGAHNGAVEVLIEPPQREAAGQRLGKHGAGPGIVVATGVAANTGRTAKKPIADIKVGDEVVATDPETGERVVRKVTRVWVHDDQVLDLVVDGEVITTTEDHLFWSLTDQRFERADQLAAGEVVLGDEGRQITVAGFRFGTERTALAYNLSIAGVHTYHVGAEAILVHNDCSDAAYQGMLHIREEIASAPRGSHSWAANMTDDELTSYLDDFVTRGGGQRLDDGSLGWYDPDRGIAIIQRSEYSMTGYTMPYGDFIGRLAN